MTSKLNHIQDWLELAKQANWSVRKLAKICNDSTRTLQRHFLKTVGKKPKVWMIEKRQKKANVLLSDGCLVKEAAVEVGYHYTNHFSRDFRIFYGFSPKQACSGPRDSNTKEL